MAWLSRDTPVLHASVEKMFAQKPRKNSNAEIKVLSKLREYGLELQAVAAVARDGVDPHHPNDLLYAIDAALEELERDPEIPEEMIRDAAKGKRFVTLETALDDYKDHRATGDLETDRLLAQRIERHKKRLKSYLGADSLSRRHLTKLRREDARMVRDGFLAEVSPASTARNINDIRAAVNRAIREHDLDMSNPFEKLEIKGGSRSRKDREPLDDTDMEKLASIMATDDDLGLIWETLRDTGARLREVAGLRVRDIDVERKKIMIVPHDLRALKTDNSERDVPIPDALVEKFAARIKHDKEALLFPRYVGGRRPDACSKALMKRLRKVVKDERKTVHSLRHRMKDLLRNTDCPEHVAREIMGHSDQSIAANYGAGVSLNLKRRALEKVWA